MQAPALHAVVDAADRQQREAGLPEQAQRVAPSRGSPTPPGQSRRARRASIASAFADLPRQITASTATVSDRL